MSFVYPLFLLAGLTLAIPVIIHLFNLRRYKTVMFPSIRFLKNIQLSSRKQSQLRYRLLLAARLLFLAALILAFAQPFLNSNKAADKGNKLQVIYIDNSQSMSVKKGQRMVLDIAKDNAARKIKSAMPGSQFIILTNDNPQSYYPVGTEKALQYVGNIDLSASQKNVSQILSTVQSLGTQDQNGAKSHTQVDFYYYSDFQTCAFPATPEQSLLQGVSFHAMPVKGDDQGDIYIDTAYLLMPVLQTGKTNKLIVKTGLSGKSGADNPVLQLYINGQMKSAATLDFTKGKGRTDTLGFAVNDAGWQKIELVVNDVSVKYDDTFRIAARCTPNLSVLEVNEGTSNPFIQAAFRAGDGFRLMPTDVHNLPQDWKKYNLVIFNGLTSLDADLGHKIADALQDGATICIFPGKPHDGSQFNAGMQLLGNVQFQGIDTAVQTVSTIQQGSDLVKELFEKLPDNVQLPVTKWHYIIKAGLDANQQSVMSFRNGDPFLAKYTPLNGILYLCADPADLESGNFPASYFFTPFLYRMAMQSGTGSIYAISSGSGVPASVSLTNATRRTTIHVSGKGFDVIPPQRPRGSGLDVYVDQVVKQPGFYDLTAQDNDTVRVALNMDKSEARLEYRDLAALKNTWQNSNVFWSEINENTGATGSGDANTFPIWKILVMLALIMLAFETWLLVKPQKENG